MTVDLNSVKSGDADRRRYHHGALRPALIEAAEAVIAERGLHGFSLREAARRAGVSQSAPAHHFGDARGLLTAVAAVAFEELGDALEAASQEGSREDRIRAQGKAYVGFALAHPARFDLMWRQPLLDIADPVYSEQADRAFRLLDRAVRGESADSGGLDPALAPSIACWSLVHGFARLAMDGAFGAGPEVPAQVAEALLPSVLDFLDV
jgi:AcrR family transcriptional regulator